MLKIYCDGSSSHTKPGGSSSGFVVFSNEKCLRQNVRGFKKNQSNNYAELYAVYEALIYCADNDIQPKSVRIYTDSLYVYNGFKNELFKNWVLNNFKNKKNKVIKHKALWGQLIKYRSYINCLFKVDSHTGVKEHDLIDKLCKDLRKLNNYEEYKLQRDLTENTPIS